MNSIMWIAKLYKRLRGRSRLFWKFCPECNSDAPKVDTCDVCYGNRLAFYRWNTSIKQDWWNRYKTKNKL